MSDQAKKFCKNCRWYRLPFSSWFAGATHQGSCLHPDANKALTDGRAFAQLEREYGKCGYAGALWEGR